MGLGRAWRGGRVRLGGLQCAEGTGSGVRRVPQWGSKERGCVESGVKVWVHNGAGVGSEARGVG